MTTYAQIDIFGEETAIPTKNLSRVNIPFYTVSLVKESRKSYNLQPINSPNTLYNTIETLFKLSEKPQEHLVLLALDTKAQVCGAFTVHIGTMNMSVCNMRDIMQRAILSNAYSIVIAHNHPSGNPTPSPEDIEVTKRLDQASQIMGIELLDHIIIGDESTPYYSLKEKGRF